MFAALAHRAARGTVSADEERAFRAINTLTPALHAPAWVVMQSGSFGAIPVAAALAFRAVGPLRSPWRSTASWCGRCARWSKRVVKRGRPADHLEASSSMASPNAGVGFHRGTPQCRPR